MWAQSSFDGSGDGSAPVVVGQVLGVHGLSGGVRARVLTDVSHRFDPGQVLHILGDPYHVASSSRSGSNQVILRFQEIDSPDGARRLVGEMMTVPEASVPPLPEGEYFHFQLLGLRVLTEDGEDLGRVSEILETGSNDVYVVAGDAGELLVPALSEVVQKVSVAEGVMVVHLPPGLR